MPSNVGDSTRAVHAGEKRVKCPECSMEFRVHWINPQLPRIRGPVWEVNRKIAEEALRKKTEGE